MKILMIVCFAWLLAGCQVLSPYLEQSRASQRQVGKVPSTTETGAQESLDLELPNQKKAEEGRRQGANAVEYLLDAASQQADKGRFLIASATIERALRIDPRSTKAYLHLAELRLKQNRFIDAEQLARKALLYISTSSHAHKLKKREAALRHIIEEARLGASNETETKMLRTLGQ